MKDASKEWAETCEMDRDCYKTGTGWSFVWAWNAAWCIIMAINFVVLAFGAFYFWPRLIGTVCNSCCLCCCHFIGLIFMLVGVGNPFARICQYNKATSTYAGDYKWDWEGRTYSGDFKFMFSCSIVMSFMWCIQITCCALPCFMTPIKPDKLKSDSKNSQQFQQATPTDRQLMLQSMPAVYPSQTDMMTPTDAPLQQVQVGQPVLMQQLQPQ